MMETLSPKGGVRRGATVLEVAPRKVSLPMCQVDTKEWVLPDARWPDARVGGWGIPGHGRIKNSDPSIGCGTFWYVGCLNVSEHAADLDGHVAGLAYVKVKKRSCGRPECPKCYESWASREAKRIAHRIEAYKVRRLKPIHFMVSPSERDWSLSLDELRGRAYAIARGVRFLGGSCMFHPFREACGVCGSPKDPISKSCLCGANHFGWYVSPHFHMIGYGWIKRVKASYEKSGWVAKNLGVRESISATAFYQLSHCGVWYGQGRKHSVTWFGCLGYRANLKVKPEPREIERCPLCQLELVPLLWLANSGSCSVPDEVGVYFVPLYGWTKDRKRRLWVDG